MQETGRISGGQMAFILFNVVVSTGALILPGVTGALAERDLWLSPVWGALVGAIALLLAFGLHRLYPNETVIQQAPRILGFSLGKTVGFLYLLSLIMLTGANVYQYTEFLKTVFLPETPDVVVMGSLILVSGLAARGGLELVARSIQIVSPISIVFLFTLLVLSMQAWDLRNIFPIMEDGPLPSLKGGIPQSFWFSELFLISFLLPYVLKGEKKMRWSAITLLAILLALVFVNLSIITIYGLESNVYLFSFFKVARYISYANFFEHLDAFAVASWTMNIFAKVAFLIYITSLGTAQWLHLSDFRPLVWPICLLAGGFGMWTAPDIFGLMAFLRTTGSWNFMTFLVFIPALLLVIGFFRRGKEARAG